MKRIALLALTALVALPLLAWGTNRLATVSVDPNMQVVTIAVDPNGGPPQLVELILQDVNDLWTLELQGRVDARIAAALAGVNAVTAAAVNDAILASEQRQWQRMTAADDARARLLQQQVLDRLIAALQAWRTEFNPQ